MHEVELTVKGLSYSQGKSGAYALILAEKGERGRKLPVVIGGAEAQSIAVAMEKSVAPPRPLTHDLLCSVVDALGGELDSVLISEVQGHTYFARLRVKVDGQVIDVDSRPSDAIAVAVTCDPPLPIFIEEDVLAEAVDG